MIDLILQRCNVQSSSIYSRYNSLLAFIRRSLHHVEEALHGRIVMSVEIETAYESILRDEVPKQWSKISYPSACSLRGYLRDLKRRVAFVREWLGQSSRRSSKASSRDGEGTPTARPTGQPEPPAQYWLPGFYFPQSFLTTLRQIHARSRGIAADRVEFNFLPMTSVGDVKYR